MPTRGPSPPPQFAHLLCFVLSLCAAAQTAQAANGTISGMVLDALSGDPIAGVEVHASSGAKRAQALTDATGHYQLPDLPAGLCSIRVYGAMHAPHAMRLVTLGAGQDLSSIDFRLDPNGMISGKVLDQNKEPVPGISVLLVARQYRLGVLRYVFARSAQTDDRSQYALAQIAPGRGFLLLAQKQNIRLPAVSDAPADVALRKKVAAPTWYPNTPEISAAEVITLRPGEQREGIDIQMTRSPSYCADGTLETPSGPDVLYFAIAEQQPTSGRSGDSAMYVSSPSGQTAKDGRIRICDLHPGTFNLTAVQLPSDLKTAPRLYGGTTIQIGDQDVHKVRAFSKPVMALHGELAWAAKAPEQPVAAKIFIMLDPITRAPWIGEFPGLNTNSSIPGQFSFPAVAIDEYSVELHGVPDDFYVKDITYAGWSILQQPLRLGASVGAPELRILLAADGGVISVRVAGKDGNPIPDCPVVILPESAASDATLAAELLSGQTDQNGNYSSARLAPGKYLVLASSEPIDQTPESMERLKSLREQGQEVTLVANGTASVALSLH